MLGFLEEDAPKNWGDLCDDVSDNFRVISPRIFGFIRERSRPFFMSFLMKISRKLLTVLTIDNSYSQIISYSNIP
jgi:hypothetical protein